MALPRILVVDDNDLFRETIVETLRDEGFNVVESSNADEADSLLIADGFRLVITDIHMPGHLDGITLAMRSHDRKPTLPIVFMTGGPDSLSRLKISDFHPIVLRKPFSLDDLISAVQTLLGSAS